MKTPFKDVPPLTVEELKDLKSRIAGAPCKPASTILEFVAKRHGTTVKSIKARAKPATIIPPRREATVLIHGIANYSFQRTAVAMGRKNHTTALYHDRMAPPEIKALIEREHAA